MSLQCLISIVLISVQSQFLWAQESAIEQQGDICFGVGIQGVDEQLLNKLDQSSLLDYQTSKFEKTVPKKLFPAPKLNSGSGLLTGKSSELRDNSSSEKNTLQITAPSKTL